MSKIFLWFYCLPTVHVIALVFFASTLFLFLRKQFAHMQHWKVGILILSVCWFAIILFVTLVQRAESGSLLEPILTPFASYQAVLNGGPKELIRTNFMNVILFYPAGLLACEVLSKRWPWFWKVVLVTVLLALVSLCVEYVQYSFGLGLAEADDVIHNTLGALLGAIACCFSIRTQK